MPALGLHDPGEHGYGTTLAVVRTVPARHGDRGPVRSETVYDGFEIAAEGSPEDAGAVRDITTTRLKAYGGPDARPDIRPDDRVYLSVDRRTDRNGRPLDPTWQVEGEPGFWGPGLSVVALKRVTG
jgi:hypothetical protein